MSGRPFIECRLHVNILFFAQFTSCKSCSHNLGSDDESCRDCLNLGLLLLCCPYVRWSACKLPELTVRSRISPQYFSDKPSISVLGGRDDGGPGGMGSDKGSHSELTLQHRDFWLIESSEEHHCNEKL